MKNSFKLFAIALLIICFSVSFVKAQEENHARFGIKGGVNFSTLYTKDVDNNKMLTGFNLGLFGKLPVTDCIALQPEFYYTTKGAEVTYNNVS